MANIIFHQTEKFSPQTEKFYYADTINYLSSRGKQRMTARASKLPVRSYIYNKYFKIIKLYFLPCHRRRRFH